MQARNAIPLWPRSTERGRGPVRMALFGRQRMLGFTLIELMVVVVIIGILFAVALPSYQQHVTNSRRSDAQANLSALTLLQERYRSNNSSYASDLSTLGGAPVSNYYNFSLIGLGTPAFVAGYEVHATPKPGTAQANDTACADMYIWVSAGQIVNKDTNPASTASNYQCWLK